MTTREKMIEVIEDTYWRHSKEWGEGKFSNLSWADTLFPAIADALLSKYKLLPKNSCISGNVYEEHLYNTPLLGETNYCQRCTRDK